MQKFIFFSIFFYFQIIHSLNHPELFPQQKIALNFKFNKILCFKINKDLLKSNSKYEIKTHYLGGV